MKKNVLIFGPIGDVGGRDVEVNIIARALAKQYDVRIFSTIYITEDSFALRGLQSVSYSSLQQEIYRNGFFIRLFAKLKSVLRQADAKPYFFIKNRFSKVFVDFGKRELEILEREVQNADLVLGCVQLTTVYLQELAELTGKKGIPLLVRTTGTIRGIDRKYFGFLRQITHFIHHSHANARNLNSQIELPYSVIDQCALSESTLLSIPNHQEAEVVFGYIGRFSPEKGVFPLVRHFTENPGLKLVIAGDGPQKEELLSHIGSSSNVEYLGHLQSEQIEIFFKKIHCLVIPSLEESGPLVGLEAMASAKIILSTKVGAMEERLASTENNFWFDIENPGSLKSMLETLTSLPIERRVQIAESVRAKYLANYTKESIARQYVQLVKEFVNESRH